VKLGKNNELEVAIDRYELLVKQADTAVLFYLNIRGKIKNIHGLFKCYYYYLLLLLFIITCLSNIFRTYDTVIPIYIYIYIYIFLYKTYELRWPSD